MGKFFDLQHPWFIPLYRRVIVTAICAGWTIVEAAMGGGPFWVMLFAALTALCVFNFFYDFKPRDPN